MLDCNPVGLPINAGTILRREGELLSDGEKRGYQAMVGAIGYLMNCTRPDLAFVMSRLAQFASCPTTAHMGAVKHVFRYIKGTVHAGLRIEGIDGHSSRVQGYFDSAFADDPDDSRSTYGYTILYGNSTILWKSKKHKGISLSTTDA